MEWEDYWKAWHGYVTWRAIMFFKQGYEKVHIVYRPADNGPHERKGGLIDVLPVGHEHEGWESQGDVIHRSVYDGANFKALHDAVYRIVGHIPVCGDPKVGHVDF